MPHDVPSDYALPFGLLALRTVLIPNRSQVESNGPEGGACFQAIQDVKIACKQAPTSKPLKLILNATSNAMVRPRSWSMARRWGRGLSRAIRRAGRGTRGEARSSCGRNRGAESTVWSKVLPRSRRLAGIGRAWADGRALTWGRGAKGVGRGRGQSRYPDLARSSFSFDRVCRRERTMRRQTAENDYAERKRFEHGPGRRSPVRPTPRDSRRRCRRRHRCPRWLAWSG